MSTSSRVTGFASSSDKHPSEHVEFITMVSQTSASTDEHPLSPGYSKSENNHSGNEDDIRPSSSQVFNMLSAGIPSLRHLNSGARAATGAEQKLSFLDGCRRYPKAMLWSFILSSTLIMEGFDTLLIFNFFSFPAFRQAFGTQTAGFGYQVSPSWQFALPTAAEAGEIVGLLLNGYLADRIGYRGTMISALIFLFLSIFLSFFAINIQMLLAAEILCGIPWGVFQTLSTAYAAEVMPIHMRAYLLSNVNLCWVWGQLFASGILRVLASNSSVWSFRIPFALQWAIGVPILIGVMFAPESPWWLIRHGRPGEAKHSLSRLTKRGKVNLDETVALMEYTNEAEKYWRGGAISYLETFKGANRRRTEIACMVWVTQQVCGTSLIGWAAYFYEQAGFDTDDAFDLSLGVFGLAVVGGVISWLLLPRVGRRRLYIGGLIALLVVLLIGGSVGAAPASRGQSWALGSLLLVLTFIYDLTIGPVCYVLVAEIPSTRLRVKTVVLARVAYNLAGLLINWMTPRMLSPTAWNWKGVSCFFFAGTTFLCLIWCYWRLPETKGLSYLEIDILFEKEAKVGKFRELRENLDNSGYFSIGNDRRPSAFQAY